MPEEWNRFKIEIGDGNSKELTTVHHVAHVPVGVFLLIRPLLFNFAHVRIIILHS